MSLFGFFKSRRKGSLEQMGPASRRQQKKSDTTKLRRKTVRGTSLVSVIVILFIWAACCFSIIWRPRSVPDLIAGQKAPTNIFAEISFTVKDLAATLQAEERARRAVADVYVRDRFTVKKRRERLDEFFNYLTAADKAPGELSQAQWGMLPKLVPKKQVPIVVAVIKDGKVRADFRRVMEDLSQRNDAGDMEWLPVLSQNDYQRQKASGSPLAYVEGEDSRKRLLRMENVVTPQQFAGRMIDAYKTKFGAQALGDAEMLVKRVLPGVVAPDFSHDTEATRRARAKAVALIREAPTTTTVRKNDPILRQGETVTKNHIEKIRAHTQELARNESGQEFLMDIASRTSWCIWATIAWMLLLFQMMPKFCHKRKNIILIGLAVTFNVLLLWATKQLVLGYLAQPPRYVLPALPLGFGAILISVLFRPKVGVMVGFLVTILAAIEAREEATFVIAYGAATATAGALAVRSVRTRLQISRASLYMPLVAVAMLAIYLLTHQVYQPSSFIWVFSIALANGIATVIIVNLFLPFAEIFFGITTDISLLELSDLNHPLLRRLSLEAPGTYAHTMMVATLAEHAAEAINANTLLTRVAAYFHDIGKLSNPAYFTENSFDGNMHEDLSPKMSARIILNHVKEGLAMANRYKLKAPLQEAIATHHGNGLVYYFYHRAKTENTLEDSGGEHEYRYPGPNPRSPEATIISLADACEAASRSLQKPTPQKIDALVDDIFKGKLFGGQLDESELTMEELLVVRETIKKTLRVMLHSRIAYPKNEEVESKVQQAGFAEKSREIERSRLMDAKEKEKTDAIKNIKQKLEEEKAKEEQKQKPKPAVAVENEEEQETDEQSDNTGEQPSDETGDSKPEESESDADGSSDIESTGDRD